MSPARRAPSKAKRYTVVIERDESGAWIAQVPALPGCHTYGKTLDQARRRIGEAVELFVDGERPELEFDVQLPKLAAEKLASVRRQRENARRTQAEAVAATEAAAKVLTEGLNLGVRDAGELLGLSHQRVQQIRTRK